MKQWIIMSCLGLVFTISSCMTYNIKASPEPAFQLDSKMQKVCFLVTPDQMSEIIHLDGAQLQGFGHFSEVNIYIGEALLNSIRGIINNQSNVMIINDEKEAVGNCLIIHPIIEKVSFPGMNRILLLVRFTLDNGKDIKIEKYVIGKSRNNRFGEALSILGIYKCETISKNISSAFEDIFQKLSSDEELKLQVHFMSQ